MFDTVVDDRAKAESVRLNGVLTRFLRLPLPFLIGCFRVLKRLFVTPKSAATLRAADKTHQSEVRRELRGLSPHHEADQPAR